VAGVALTVLRAGGRGHLAPANWPDYVLGGSYYIKEQGQRPRWCRRWEEDLT